MPCPAPWFSEFSTLKSAAEQLRCKVWEVDTVPVKWKAKALAYAKVLEKAKPALDRIAEQRAEQKQKEREMRKRNGG
jgi:hypothetical protein